MNINIGIADDHQLFLKSLGTLISSFENCSIALEALNGKSLIEKLSNASVLPDLILLDVNMPDMDGAQAAAVITKRYPQIKLVALSMKDDDLTVITMLKAGCCAYLLKDIHPDELEKAIWEVFKKGYYNADLSNINFRRLILHEKTDRVIFSEREKSFLKLACSDLTYKQIAAEMFLSERTIDGYREALFEKLAVQSRVGMVLEALRRKLVELDQVKH